MQGTVEKDGSAFFSLQLTEIWSVAFSKKSTPFSKKSTPNFKKSTPNFGWLRWIEYQTVVFCVLGPPKKGKMPQHSHYSRQHCWSSTRKNREEMADTRKKWWHAGEHCWWRAKRGASKGDSARQTGSGKHRRGKRGMLFRLAAGGDMIGSGRCQWWQRTPPMMAAAAANRNL